MSELNLCGYLTSQFYLTPRNVMHTKIHAVQYFTDDVTDLTYLQVQGKYNGMSWLRTL